MNHSHDRDRIVAAARAIESLASALSGSDYLDEARTILHAAKQRGHFTPTEDDQLWGWYARYLTARRGLQEVIHELRPDARRAETDEHAWHAFVVAYTASALLVRAARALVEDLARDALVQRKLNQRHPLYRIPRGQFTKIYRNLADPFNARRLDEAMQLANSQRARFATLAADPDLAPLLGWLAQAEPALRISRRRALWGHLRYRWHASRRRGASGLKLGRFKVLEACGRIVSAVGDPWHRRRVTTAIRDQIEAQLQPGDVIVTRRHNQFTNLFLPGYWPHALLFVGASGEPGRPVLEARKDGVLLRSLRDALECDAFAVIRPTLDAASIHTAVERAMTHRNKLYDFDFDFFTSDRLVCTELVYRAYDGLGGVEFTLVERAGKPTLSAEDILAMAVAGHGFAPLAVFGVRGTRRRLVTAAASRVLIARSLNRPR